MPDRELLLVVNPAAGKGTLKNDLFTIVNALTQQGWRVTVLPLGEGERISALLQKEKESDKTFARVVACGGDGTFSELVSAALGLEKAPVLGWIPSGTTNDFAMTLGLTGNIEQDTKTAGGNLLFQCDVGQFNRRSFSYVAAFGAFTDVPYSTPQQSKNLLGRAAYLWEGMKRVGNLKGYPMRIEADGRCVDGTFLYGGITNSSSVAGFRPGWAPDLLLDDGKFEVLFVRMPKNVFALNDTAQALMGQRLDSRRLFFTRCNELQITALSPAPWTLDGEFGGEPREIVIRNLPRAVTLAVPSLPAKSLQYKEQAALAMPPPASSSAGASPASPGNHASVPSAVGSQKQS